MLQAMFQCNGDGSALAGVGSGPPINPVNASK